MLAASAPKDALSPRPAGDAHSQCGAKVNHSPRARKTIASRQEEKSPPAARAPYLPSGVRTPHSLFFT
jgi:hypothetical protein